MDILAVVGLVAGIAGILSLIYVALIGQRTIPEMLRGKGSKRNEPNEKRTQHVVRHNLPQPEFGEFIGRTESIQKIIELLRPYPQSNYHIISIDGVGGVGKSSLALAIAHMYLASDMRVSSEEPFQNIIWVSAKESILPGMAILPRGNPLQTLDDLCQTIGMVIESKQVLTAGHQERLRLVNSLLSQERTLLIIDNLETVRDKSLEAFIHELPAPTKAIVTTRHRIDVAFPIRLDGMPYEESRSLIANECMEKDVELSELSIGTLHNLCGGLPLAMVWSIGLLSLGYGVETVFSKLKSADQPIVQFCFEASIAEISERPSLNVLLARAIFPDPATTEALRYVTQLTATELDIDELIGELEKLSLISRRSGRIVMLPLTTQFALSLLRQQNEMFATYVRRYFLYYAELVERILGDDFWGSNISWRSYPTLDDEIGNICHAVELAYQSREWKSLLAIVVPLTHYLGTRGLFDERIRQANLAIEAANKLRLQNISCMMLIAGIGWIHIVRNDWASATAHIEKGLSLSTMIGFSDGIVLAHAHLARIAYMQGNLERAKQTLLEVEANDASGIIKARLELMWALIDMADQQWQSAEGHIRKAMEWQYYPWPALNIALGEVLMAQENFNEAEAALKYALAVTEEMQKTTDREGALFGLAQVARRRGQWAKAHELAQAALPLYKRYRSETETAKVEEFIRQVSAVRAGPMEYWLGRLRHPDAAK